MIESKCVNEIFNKSKNMYLHGDTAQNPDARWVRDTVVQAVKKGDIDVCELNNYLKESLTPEQAYCVVKLLEAKLSNFTVPTTEVSEMLTLGLIDFDTYTTHIKGLQDRDRREER